VFIIGQHLAKLLPKKLCGTSHRTWYRKLCCQSALSRAKLVRNAFAISGG